MSKLARVQTGPFIYKNTLRRTMTRTLSCSYSFELPDLYVAQALRDR
jgi:hypothetical protein